MSTEAEVPSLEDVPEILEKIKLKDSTKSEKNNSTKKKVLSDEDKFCGMTKGFLFEKKKKSQILKKHMKHISNEDSSEEIPFIKGKKDSNLTLKEVQESMKPKFESHKFQEHFTSKVTTDPKVSKILSDPNWVGILDEFQKDPTKAMLKYDQNKEVKETMLYLCSILGDSFLHMLPSEKSEEEALIKAVQDDPKVKEALSDLYIEKIMKCIKNNENDKVQRFLKEANPRERSQIQMLIDYGLFSFAS